MSLRVGVIGAGAMGADHVRTISTHVPSARVSAVFDMDTERAKAVAAPAYAAVPSSALELIGSGEVDAVVIASPDFTHADLVKACLAEGKMVLCEKPLALTPEETWGVVEAEVAVGRRMIQVGFMRHYDPSHVALRETLRSGRIGQARLVHAVARNASNATSTSDAGIVTGSMIHELDEMRWLLDDEIVSFSLRSPVKEGLKDPQLAVLEMASGTLVSIDCFVNASYGYDIRCEVVGTLGTASLVPPALVETRIAGADAREVRDDFVAHFADAYRLELGAWASDALSGVVNGPTAWDGHVANVVAAAGIASLEAGGAPEPVVLPERPALYA